tara:strand:+ start:1339 stop:1605 length:267 start_codon:yes stop_codon:yes gene_type:complete
MLQKAVEDANTTVRRIRARVRNRRRRRARIRNRRRRKRKRRKRRKASTTRIALILIQQKNPPKMVREENILMPSSCSSFLFAALFTPI